MAPNYLFIFIKYKMILSKNLIETIMHFIEKSNYCFSYELIHNKNVIVGQVNHIILYTT